MDSTQLDEECQICSEFQYTNSVGYIEKDITRCSRCGNNVRLVNHPAIYLGTERGYHILVIAFPGCTNCGVPTGVPSTITMPCISRSKRDNNLLEVYHNYSRRN